jgi:hypothetical protein
VFSQREAHSTSRGTFAELLIAAVNSTVYSGYTLFDILLLLPFAAPSTRMVTRTIGSKRALVALLQSVRLLLHAIRAAFMCSQGFSTTHTEA